ncbi:hypothetical protein E4L96_03290 [Massilia arenosa]|uniref:Uncharacterized protein n=1 Tax=Zemynaea arenosa TaxID=2561931 RepID=A0A4Y9SMC3_9BURK|nr:hypothetical protein [Massilia arenosa]TFW27800.1 hypothetical protein E4L96_03290 [Massilia arenosa]
MNRPTQTTGAAWHAHSTPDPEIPSSDPEIPPQPERSPVPDDVPPPEHSPVREPTPPGVTIRAT